MAEHDARPAFERRRIVVFGVVQGIGFRPFVYRLAQSQALTGWVRNDGGGVTIELQGPTIRLDDFARKLEQELPPGGRIDRQRAEPMPSVDEEKHFVIADSAHGALGRAALAPDRSVCAACARELREPTDRRFGYPFINCTHCGPRYTIAKELPYDRPNTTMAAFGMCADCDREYRDPSDRRYHAEPVACPACGPRIWLARQGDAAELRRADASADVIAQAIRLLGEGQVVAVKGIGGFHLAADARNQDAVARLRAFKQRPRKPLAVMVRDLATARAIVQLDEPSVRLLCSPASPIVLCPAQQSTGLSPLIAPGLTDLGVMLPYSPLHQLLFDGPLDVLVMTSGNHPSEPITTDNREALELLAADAFVLHDRDIHVANDDSVVRVSAAAQEHRSDAPSTALGEPKASQVEQVRSQRGTDRPSCGRPSPSLGRAQDGSTALRRSTSELGPVFMRRSRGYVPEPLDATHLPERSVLALGAQLKVTVAALSHGELAVGRHLGDLDNPRAEEAFRSEVERVLRFGQLEPEIVAVDLHPDLASTLYAEAAFADRAIARVQHHHAHLGAVLAEHAVAPGAEAVGIVLDGFGHGSDGTIWGGEVLCGSYSHYERIGHLRYVPQPGGDRAAIEPGRMATSHLLDAGLAQAGVTCFDDRIAEVCSVRSVAPWTSSAGRLFDAVAAILGVAPASQDFEGEAAARLEAVADPRCDDAYPLPSEDGVLDTRALIEALVRDSASTGVRAARFHNALADGLVAVAECSSAEVAVLGGGCMVNRMLLGRLIRQLRASGRQVLWPRLLPPGDGGLSAGQAACAACRLQEGGAEPCA